VIKCYNINALEYFIMGRRQKMKKIVIIAILLIAAYFAYPFVYFMLLNDEGQIAQKIKNTINSVEAANINGIAKLLAEDFIGEESVDKNGFKLLLMSLFKSFKEPKVETMILKVSLDAGKKEATVQYRGKLMARPENNPTRQAVILEFKFYFKKYERGGWLIYKYDEIKSS